MREYGSSYRMPDGSSTYVPAVHRSAWEEYILPLEEVLRVRVSAYDPDFQIQDTLSNRHGSIPFWLACRIIGKEYPRG